MAPKPPASKPPDDHVCLTHPCWYCLVTAGKPIPASLLVGESVPPDLQQLLEAWHRADKDARQSVLEILKVASVDAPRATKKTMLRVEPGVRRRQRA